MKVAYQSGFVDNAPGRQNRFAASIDLWSLAVDGPWWWKHRLCCR